MANEAEHPEGDEPKRNALLLELGALVYELHRRGKRAPELLQKKAAELDDLGNEPDVDRDSSGNRQVGGEPCPTCGEPAESGQLVCLNCGERLELGREQQQKSKAGALAALIAVVAIGAAAAGFALSELTSGSEEKAQRTAQPAPEPEPAPTAEPEPAPTAEPEPAPEAEGAPQPAKQSLLLTWPRNLSAHPVVLVNTSDRAAARQVARAAARSGIEAGLLRSEDYDLGTGLWIVFAGRFDTRRGAESQAGDLAERYPGAYVQLVEPRSQ